MHELFRRLAHRASEMCGSPWGFGIAVCMIILWALAGPIMGFSQMWQLIINTATTIFTFLLVFLIQNTQNRDSRAMHLKLDELIKVTKEARNTLIDLEEMSDDEIEKLQKEFQKVRDTLQS